jgi:hypothetical protein
MAERYSWPYWNLAHGQARRTYSSRIEASVSQDRPKSTSNSSNVHGLVADKLAFRRLVVDTSLNKLFDHVHVLLAPAFRIGYCEKELGLSSNASLPTSLP